jgi:hypothetical protein
MSYKPGNIKLNSRKDADIPEKNDLPGMAKYMEEHNRPEEAAKLYEKLLKTERLRENNYNRLMMIYRRKKDYKNELRVINEGIRAFQDLYMPMATGKHKTIVSLSKKLNIMIGLTDKKGRHLSDREPIAKWKKRKTIVLKKLAAKK